MIRINFWRVNFIQILKESLSVCREAFCYFSVFNLLEYQKPGLDKSSQGLLSCRKKPEFYLGGQGSVYYPAGRDCSGEGS